MQNRMEMALAVDVKTDVAADAKQTDGWRMQNFRLLLRLPKLQYGVWRYRNDRFLRLRRNTGSGQGTPAYRSGIPRRLELGVLAGLE